MALRFVISMTSSRPSRCSLAFVYSLRSSATQGSTRIPSTTSWHWRGLLMTEIFNMPHSSLQVRECNTYPKLCSCNYFKFQDGIEIGQGRSRRCQSMSFDTTAGPGGPITRRSLRDKYQVFLSAPAVWCD